MNKIGIHYAYWAKNWDVDFRKYIIRAASLGFDVIEFDLGGFFNRTGSELDDIIAVARDAGIEMTFCVGFADEFDMSSEDPAIKSNGIRHAVEDLKLIGRLGGTTFSGITYGAWQPQIKGLMDDKRPWLERSAQSVREVSKVADDLGIQNNIEIVNRFEQFLINTVDEGLAFLEMVGNPRVKLLLDTFHMNIEEDSFRDAILKAGDKIGHFHIGEANRKVPGSGRLPWDEIFGALRETGYQGRIVMEPFVKMGGEVGKAILVWRDLVSGDEKVLDEDARMARNFVYGKLL